jgi:hypothetical protein
MKPHPVLALVLSCAAAALPAAAQEAETSAGEEELRVEIVTFKVTGTNTPPEPAQSFVIGETAAYGTFVKGFGTRGQAGVDLRAGYELETPEGKRETVPSGVAAKNTKGAGERGVPLQPVMGLTFKPVHASGIYFLNVTVTDMVSQATATARAPIYVFLTPGAREQITRPMTNAPTALDTTLLAPGFWDMSVDDVAAAFWADGFGWTSEDRSGIRSKSPKVAFMGQELAEAQIRFAQGKPGEVWLSLYNRGDKGVVSNELFTNMTASLSAQISKVAGRAPQDLTPRTATNPNQKTTILGWPRERSFYRVEYAWSAVKQEGASKRQFLPEFITVTIIPNANLTRAEMAGQQKTDVNMQSLARRVIRAENGDVYLDVAMRDQGEKGYCAAAAMERVMDYYGTDVDQHEIAQRIMMQTGGGATFEGIVKGLRAIAHTLGVQVKMLIEQDARSFTEMIEDYNKLAKKRGLPLIDLRQPRGDAAYGGKSIWEMFDKDLFLESRLKNKLDVEKFFKMCEQKIEIGVPLFQCCVIGILPEEAKLGQDPGGHLRLIVGYNAKTKELLYTDSWGVGHERKRMSLDYTFAITTGLFTLEPK